eukprot:m.63011 g.63011  ORF g.63011 m.63011 type:complete len:374 (+) comp13945_c0_seq1:116-1237(+)
MKIRYRIVKTFFATAWLTSLLLVLIASLSSAWLYVATPRLVLPFSSSENVNARFAFGTGLSRFRTQIFDVDKLDNKDDANSTIAGALAVVVDTIVFWRPSDLQGYEPQVPSVGFPVSLGFGECCQLDEDLHQASRAYRQAILEQPLVIANAVELLLPPFKYGHTFEIAGRQAAIWYWLGITTFLLSILPAVWLTWWLVGHVTLLSALFQIIGIVIYYTVAPDNFAPLVIDNNRYDLELSTSGILAIVGVITTLAATALAYFMIDIQKGTLQRLAQTDLSSTLSRPLSRQPSAAGSLSSRDIKIGPTLPSRSVSQASRSQGKHNPTNGATSLHTNSNHGSADPLPAPPLRLSSFQLGGGDLDQMLERPLAQAHV